MNESTNIAISLWNAMEARDWATVASLLDPAFRCEYPQSGERFDRDGYLKLNREYPGNWHVRIRTVLPSGDWTVTEIECDIDDRTESAISFFRIRDGKVAALREFWPEPFAAPEWRRGFALRGE